MRGLGGRSLVLEHLGRGRVRIYTAACTELDGRAVFRLMNELGTAMNELPADEPLTGCDHVGEED